MVWESKSKVIVMLCNLIENKKDQNTSIVPNAKDDKEKEEVNIPYSCIPQLEKNDQSYNWENFA